MERNASDLGLARSRGEDQRESMRSHESVSSGRTRRERERARCTEEIIGAASKLFAQFGIDKTSMKQIAGEADMSVGKLYTYFGGKEEIVRRLLDNAFKELERRGDEACRVTDAPLEQLRCRLKSAIEHFQEHIDFLMIYHNENPMSCKGMIREEIEKNLETVARLLVRAIDDGEIAPEEPRALAAMLIGSVHELLHMYAEGGNKEAFEEVPAIIDRIILRPLETRQAGDCGMEGR
jgi:AcrR family transcriptional regulator